MCDVAEFLVADLKLKSSGVDPSFHVFSISCWSHNLGKSVVVARSLVQSTTADAYQCFSFFFKTLQWYGTNVVEFLNTLKALLVLE